jgi:hypothetical protein
LRDIEPDTGLAGFMLLAPAGEIPAGEVPPRLIDVFEMLVKIRYASIFHGLGWLF